MCMYVRKYMYVCMLPMLWHIKVERFLSAHILFDNIFQLFFSNRHMKVSHILKKSLEDIGFFKKRGKGNFASNLTFNQNFGKRTLKILLLRYNDDDDLY